MTTTTDQERTVLGACPHDCPDTCSFLVKVKGGKVISVQGNPDHPFTQGRLCAKTNHYEERVHHPDRVLYPMRRSGPKGSGQFKRISWDDALGEIAKRWKRIIAESGPTAILPYSYLGCEGLVNGLTVGDPFFNKLGATVSERTFCDSGACTAYIMTVGPTPGMDPESFAHSKFIILWACNILSTNPHMWPFVAQAQKNGAKVVVIDPVRTKAAELADQHIRIRPGTDAALALAMMNVIIGEKLTDADYVAKYTTGFDELAPHVAQYTPEFAQEQTGVDAAVIRTLAREYAKTQPSAIRIGVGIERSAGGGQLVRTLTCLPALVGAWRKPGGGILQLPLWAFPINWPGLHRSDLLPPGTRVINQWEIGRALTGQLRLDPPIRSLFVYNSNPLVVAPDQARTRQGMEREDLFTVVSEQFMTDTARYADLVLPATTQMEQLDLMFSWGHLYMTMNEKAIEPLGEAVSNSELFRRLARVMGFEDPFFYRDDEQLMRESMDWSAPAMAGITLESLRAKGYQRLTMPAADKFALHAEGAFPTPSGKVELKASMAAAGNFVLPVFRQGSNDHQDGGPSRALPTWIAPHEAAPTHSQYPLSMLAPKAHAYLNSQYPNLKRQHAHQGPQFILIHPTDAKVRSIDDKATVQVVNGRGSFLAQAKVTDEVMAGVVVAPFGDWMSQVDGGATPAALTPTAYADLGRAPTFSDNRVEVSLPR
ncbi:MAG TPA: molybdopterin-dependent oxidoreductase [Rubrivivax sp.]|nr:molybdopterin-dependent oxidoreductase [Rubrivivax sp.]